MRLSDIAVDRIVSVAQARAIGIDANALRRLHRAGEIHRLVPGWYAVGTPATAADRHMLRARAYVRHLDGEVVASHHSAVLLHGLPTMTRDLETVHVCRVRDRSTRRGTGLAVHPALRLPPEATGVTPVAREGERVPPVAVPVAVAVLQTGMVNGPLDTLVAGDAALRRRLITEDDVRAAVSLLARQPGMGAVRAVLGHLDGRHESPGETRLALVMRGLGLSFTPQVWIRGLQDWRVDFLLDDHPVIVEFDGMVKYAGTDHAPGRNPLVAEKRREDALRELGYEVVRVTWRDLADPRLLRRRIEAAIARARARAGQRP
jgi:very-short-patch-repair endonuclease